MRPCGWVEAAARRPLLLAWVHAFAVRIMLCWGGDETAARWPLLLAWVHDVE